MCHPTYPSPPPIPHPPPPQRAISVKTVQQLITIEFENDILGSIKTHFGDFKTSTSALFVILILFSYIFSLWLFPKNVNSQFFW